MPVAKIQNHELFVDLMIVDRDSDKIGHEVPKEPVPKFEFHCEQENLRFEFCETNPFDVGHQHHHFGYKIMW